MKIISLTAENIKKLVAVEITPDGNMVQITGKNGQGKTSVLDSIWWALAGAAHIQSQPIRKGANSARIRLDLGEIVVERKFSETGSTLTVENAEGARFPSPQKMLDSLLGALSFDPLAFSRMDPRKQFDELRRVSQLDVDIDRLDALNKGAYQQRTEVNRDAKAKRAQADGIVVPPAAGEPVDESALVDDLQRAGDHNAVIEQRKSGRENVRAEATRHRDAARGTRDRADLIRAQLAELEQSAAQSEQVAAEMEKKLEDAPPLPDLIDTTALRQKIDQARLSNKTIATQRDMAKRKEDALAEAEALEAKAKQLTDTMAAREKEKADAIKRANMPVEGLGFGEGMVTYKGVPFDQASSAEQLQVSLAIAMASNPKLRVIRIQDGSLLDDDALQTIATIAKESDYQIWIERVDTSGKIGFMLQDGVIVSNEAAA